MTVATQRPRRLVDSLIVGFAMFAVFFGAGNLIFPPHIGFLAGADWFPALAGLVLTGMLLPVIGVLAVGLGGGTFEQLTRPIAPWFGTAFVALGMVCIGWLITIPRTAAVAYEMGVQTLIPQADGLLADIIFIAAYFAISLYFAIDRSTIIDKIGEYLTPLLLALLVGIVIWAIVLPVGTPAEMGTTSPFYDGFITGYQTGDVLTGLIFGLLFIEAIKARGYDEGHGYVPVLLGSALVTFLGLFVVYGGLTYLGATGSGLLPAETERAPLLTELVGRLAGDIGAVALAVAVILACLTTAVGATAVMARYIEKWGSGRITYVQGAILTTLVAMVQAFGGVEYIVTIAGPIFMLMYPLAIGIAVLGLVSRLFTNDGVWKGMAIMAILFGAYDSANLLSGMFGFALPPALVEAHARIPLADQGFAWLVPSILGSLVGGIIWRRGHRTAAVSSTPAPDGAPD